MADQVVVQRRFTVAAQGVYPAFTDALNLTEAEHASLTPAQIAQLKADRYTAWQATMDAIRTAPPLTGPQDVAEAKLFVTASYQQYVTTLNRRDQLSARLAARGVTMNALAVKNACADNLVIITLAQAQAFLSAST